MLGPGCEIQKPEIRLEPYQYTSTTQLKQFELYEYSHIKDADRSVVTTLSELGYHDLVLAGEGSSTPPSIEYSLPDNAVQGPDIWYIIRFHFLIEFAGETGNGFCDVTASANDGAAAMVNFKTMIVDSSPFIRLHGQSSTSTRLEVRYYNYLSNMAVEPGKNVLTFKLKEFQQAKVKSLLILNDTGIESTTVPPKAQAAGPAPEPGGYEPFYGVSPELTARLQQICLADSRVQGLIKDRVHSFTVEGHTVEDKDYNLAVSVRLKNDITAEQFREWMESGRQDSSLIKEYVGVLNIGYNDKYHIVIDVAKEEIKELTQEERSGPGIPEATAEEKQRAVAIAFSDVTLQQILKGKDYRVAPDGIGVWHSGATKLGVVFEIQFDRTYTLDCELPRYQEPPYHYSGEAGKLLIGVLLEESRVANIVPLPPSSVR